ncbi:MAG: class I SAM-dependent methyltransferase [Deltaproteobacteria bacterium]|nr:class I SAM-dependent methyltransferase [Deltaproteobacteria bacterium]
MAEEKAYSQAANTGKYDKDSRLLGKYDNVRRFWEDQVTALFLRPALNELVERKRIHLERIRILDLGCGSGDGYDLVMGVTTKDPGIYENITSAITPDMLKEYVGVDINKDLLTQAKEHYGNNPKVRFICGDLSNGLPDPVVEEAPFDIYFTSYGTLSHLRDHENVKLIVDICRHAPSNAILVGDWLGRYSYEWQTLWHHPVDQEYFMDYRISYIYPDNDHDTADVTTFPLRLITKDEVMKIIDQVANESGVQIKPLRFFDRSIYIGRHMDTGDYNEHAPKSRRLVNSLFEDYSRTDLESLLVDYVPRQGFSRLNAFFEMFFLSCNALIEYTMKLLSNYDYEKGELFSVPEVLSSYPEPLKEAMFTIQRLIEGVGWLKYGDVRANVIEPQLGYMLRKLEIDLQPGIGVGHSLIGIFEIIKE